MNFRKLLGITAIFAATVLILSGCGGTSARSTTNAGKQDAIINLITHDASLIFPDKDTTGCNGGSFTYRSSHPTKFTSGPYSDLVDSDGQTLEQQIHGLEGTPVVVKDSTGKILAKGGINDVWWAGDPQFLTTTSSFQNWFDLSQKDLTKDECIFSIEFWHSVDTSPDFSGVMSPDNRIPLGVAKYFIYVGNRKPIEITPNQWSTLSTGKTPWVFNDTLSSSDSNGGFIPNMKPDPSMTQDSNTNSQASWVLNGYTFDSTSNTAWLWDNSVVQGCSNNNCAGMRLILNPNNGSCTNGFLVEVTEKDSSGANIGKSVANTGSMQPGDKANLTFHLDSGTNKVYLSSIRCE